MNKKILMIPIIMIITVFVINFSFDSSEIENNILFHATLADPDLYTNGVYIDKFTINKGEYFFRFVPNGSSPEVLSITLDGKNFDFSENFKLEDTSHQTGISEYFTWDYNGQKIISISDTQEISITINPNGNIMGSVTVDILEN
ncbi:MAG: hypothetical protein OEQ15_00860 [Nitrosopumilus sp.]|nr:hypothetical protein [Nitrosopumilus sp.]